VSRDVSRAERVEGFQRTRIARPRQAVAEAHVEVHQIDEDQSSRQFVEQRHGLCDAVVVAEWSQPGRSRTPA